MKMKIDVRVVTLVCNRIEVQFQSHADDKF